MKPIGKEPNNSFESIVLDSFKENSSLIPSHIAIIMEGNRRWAAKKKGLGKIKSVDVMKDYMKFLSTLKKEDLQTWYESVDTRMQYQLDHGDEWWWNFGLFRWYVVGHKMEKNIDTRKK